MYGESENIYAQTLEEIQSAGLYKRERLIESPQSARITVNGKQVLNFCANNYLGLADHPRLIAAAKRGLDEFGLGLASVRFICGTQTIHRDLEQSLAKFLGMDDSILYASCFDANGGLFETLLGEEDAIVSDSLNHASIIDGIRLSKAKRFRYQHNDLADLERNLKEARATARTVMIATDGAFSMDGDIAPLPAICDLAEKYSALLMIDECHATGFLGRNGRGSPEYCGVEGRIDIINSTLGKALGGAVGGFTAARQEIVDLLRQRSRPYLFSNSLPPALITAGLECLSLLNESGELREKLTAHTSYFRKAVADAGFTIRGKDHPIVPIMIGDAALAAKMADELLAEGIYVIGFSYPVVPKGEARIRIQLSAAHEREDLEGLLGALVRVGRGCGVV